MPLELILTVNGGLGANDMRRFFAKTTPLFFLARCSDLGINLVRGSADIARRLLGVASSGVPRSEIRLPNARPSLAPAPGSTTKILSCAWIITGGAGVSTESAVADERDTGPTHSIDL